MTDNNHPITPPPELIRKWNEEAATEPMADQRYIATQAARWGADQELDACCKWLPKLPPWSADDLRKHRRSKPPSLKEQALKALDQADKGLNESEWQQRSDTIRRALESLPN